MKTRSQFWYAFDFRVIHPISIYKIIGFEASKHAKDVGYLKDEAKI